ncbi:uncharacterized protein LOC125684414 [Lagopus muta]|uniref:uncharacterized protein LOC125684414 n=1 Tax=Lagopus muta TaxID=64668 RepID=UPI00209CFCC7|nr:uncharacterized protein LOC125684414 [Lagopus muta]
MSGSSGYNRRTRDRKHRSPLSVSSRLSVLSPAHVAGDTAGKQRLSSVPKEISQQSTHRLRVCIRAKLQVTQSANPATGAQAPSTRSPQQARVPPAQVAAPGRSWRRRRGQGGGGAGGAEPGLAGAARRGRRSGGMRQCRAAGLAGLAAVLLVAVSTAQVQQEPSAGTSEGTGINITCSHPNIQSYDYIYWYRQLPSRSPAFIEFIHQGSKELHELAGQLSMSADRRSSALWLARPRFGDAAVYYCAVNPRGVESGLRQSKNSFGRGGWGGRRRSAVRTRRGRCRSFRRAASPLPAAPS